MSRYLITSALPYINGVKHLGNLIGSMLPADVYARFLRQKGHEVLLICGTDEHGTPAEIAAQDEKKDIETYCREMYEKQKALCDQFSLSFDYFGRSSSPSNHQLTAEIFQDLQENGFIETHLLKLFYSEVDKRFLPDRYVMGTCPKCHYEKARGDQCDGCGSLLDSTDLLNPYSALSGDRNLILKESQHYFLKLDTLQDSVQNFVESHDWNAMTKGIAKKWLQEGLKERCISRDLKWGILIPGSDKVFYVWFDAPNAYISITIDCLGKEKAMSWWYDSSDVIYTQFMAKDNVPFHAIFWPAVLMGTGKAWHQVDQLKSFGWLTYEGGKFSTSQKRGVFMDQALELYPCDYWRYFLMAHIPENDDADFSFQMFAQTINKDLADILGNFINRVSTLIHKYCDGVVLIEPLEDQHFDALKIDYENSLSHLQFRQAMSTLRKIWDFGNEFIARYEPWKLIKMNEQEARRILAQSVWLIREYARLATPIIPDTCRKIEELIVQKDQHFHVGPSQPLFQKITEEEIALYTKRFDGIHSNL